MPRAHDAIEIALEEGHARAFHSNVCSRTHGNADIGGRQSGSVIDAISRHGDYAPLSAQTFDDLALVFGQDFRFHIGPSQNQLAAYYMGIPVRRINGLVWGLSAAVAALAGLLLAPITFVHANMGFIGLKAFPAAVIGGFGSLPGAIVGGLIIGIVESLSGFYLPEGFKDVAAYVVVLAMLVIKPNGLFGETMRKKV